MDNSNTLRNMHNLELQRETFITSLGHDLKNPTIAQIRAMELFIKGFFGKLTPEQEDVAQMVLDSCRYMLAMLGSLVETYRYDSGSIKLNSDQVSISDLAEECIEEMVYLAKDKQVQITFENSAAESIVWGDKVQIKRVVMNLLSNGIKYAYRNSKLIVRIYTEKNYTCFEFENSSPFIPLRKRKEIFARYVTFAEAHNQFGIGLGLYVSKKIIEAHNGEIFVKSYQNDKNIFGFKIPNDKSYAIKRRFVTF